MKKLGNKKKIILGSILGIFIGALLGTTYAMYTYNSSSVNNKLIAGDIYMKYKETSAINLSGAMPSATYPDSTTGNYFEFQIVGKNTSSKDITYNVKLAYGDEELDANDNPKTRIDDEHLVFKLVEVVNNEEVSPALVNDRSFNNIPGATLYTATIPHGTNNETTRTFRVYARISENVGIGTNTTYTIQEWNNLYASVKINVDGGFVNGGNQQIPTLIENATSASCFTTTENVDGTLKITDYDEGTCGLDVVIPNIIDVNMYPPTTVSNEKNNNNLLTLPNKIETNNNIVMKTTNENWKIVTIIGYMSFKNKDIESLVIPNTITDIEDWAFYNNNLINVNIPNSVENIGRYAFSKNYIESLTLGSGLLVIDVAAFSDAVLTSLDLPESLWYIGTSAFRSSDLTSLTLPYNLTSISPFAFEYSHISHLIVNSSDINYIPLIDSDESICAMCSLDFVEINNAYSIPNNYFENAKIDNLIIGNNVRVIGSNSLALYYDSPRYDPNISLPSGLISIASDAFGSDDNPYKIRFNKPCDEITSMTGYPFGAARDNIVDNESNYCYQGGGEETSPEH